MIFFFLSPKTRSCSGEKKIGYPFLASQTIKSDLCRSKATTTATSPSIYTGCWRLFVSRGVVPSVLNITSAEMCFLRGALPLTGRRRRRRASRWTGRRREESHNRNHRPAFLGSFKHPLHQPLPDLSAYPLPPQLALKGTLARSFPLSTLETKGCVGCVFTRGPLSMSEVFSKSPLRFRFFPL